MLLFNLRGEPVIYVKEGYDMVTYSIRESDALSDTLADQVSCVSEANELEMKIRKEVTKLLRSTVRIE